MCEPEESNGHSNTNPARSKGLLMELDDLDLDASWPLDQIALVSNPLSPLVVSSSEQPFSPLWAFSDSAAASIDDERLASASAVPSFRLSDYPFLLACTPSSVADNTKEEDKRSLVPSPVLGFLSLEPLESCWLIKERMTQALRNFKESTEQQVLAQVWAPVKNGGRYVLTTCGQPFVLDPNSKGLNQYRTVSLTYMFSVDGENDGEFGLPGRVYRQGLPEWTPNVQYYSSREFSRLDHAQNYNVRGTVALPVFSPSGHSCVGVVELIMTSEKIHYAPEVDKVCKALEAVNLKSSEIVDHQTTQICNESRQNALAEILEVLTAVCETHKLPLAQTWIPCRHGGVLANGGGLKKSCMSFDGSCKADVCMSVTDVASYIVDAHVWGFRDACAEHHLQKGQGVPGRAFLSRNLCFCRDVTKFCKTDYPLVHYARMFKLTSCFAICLQSTHTGDDDYILEFFLPPAITNPVEQDALFGSVLGTMKQHFQSLRVASQIELSEDEVSLEVLQASAEKKVDSRIELIKIPHPVSSPRKAEDNGFLNGNKTSQLNGMSQQSLFNTDLPSNKRSNPANPGENQVAAPTPEVIETKKPERKRGKAEKMISLDVLQQYFAGSLKDAAKSLGVCPTTMKRICRQHGISRWPSRKINKVNRSLTKLKRVIESVQGTDGALDLTSLAPSQMPVTVGSISWQSSLNEGHQLNPPSPKPLAADGAPIPQPAACQLPPLGGSPPQEAVFRHQKGFAEQCKPCKTRSGSKEESGETPTSHGSCEGSPGKETQPATTEPPIATTDQEHCFPIRWSPGSAYQPAMQQPLYAPVFSVPDAIFTTEIQPPFGGMLLEDSGSSKDLRNLCPAVAEAILDERLNGTDSAKTPPRATPGKRVITIKATYREDIIRFRISMSSGIMELKEEVAKRLKLDMGTFDIKYLDDDQELVLIACDIDLQECLEVAKNSGSNIARLSVHDMTTNFGSSCESTGEL